MCGVGGKGGEDMFRLKLLVDGGGAVGDGVCGWPANDQVGGGTAGRISQSVCFYYNQMGTETDSRWCCRGSYATHVMWQSKSYTRQAWPGLASNTSLQGLLCIQMNRQELPWLCVEVVASCCAGFVDRTPGRSWVYAVSYTHLTLPTTERV